MGEIQAILKPIKEVKSVRAIVHTLGIAYTTLRNVLKKKETIGAPTNRH